MLFKRVLSFEQADRLTFEVMAFLAGCGSLYQNYNNLSHACLLATIAVNQYCFKRDKYFFCWWMVDKDCNTASRQIPEDIISGDYMYIVECGCKNKSYMPEIVKKLKKIGRYSKGVFWYNNKRKKKVFFKNRMRV